MGDSWPVVRAAAVQAAPVFLDRDASTEKACALIAEAGAAGAELVVFPEGFIPAHPSWFHFHIGSSPVATDFGARLFTNAVEVPGPQTDRIARAAAEAGVYVVMGVCERLPGTFGSMYNTQVFFGPEGTVLGKHQKLAATATERLVHRGGHGDTLSVMHTSFGPLSGLICGENSNPLAIFTMAAQHTMVHAMSWPSHFSMWGPPMRQRTLGDSIAFARMTKAYVVSSCSVVDDATVSALMLTEEQEETLRGAECGGSVVVGPEGKLRGDQLGDVEGILYADLDLSVGVREKLQHDFVGHYNRDDVFELRLNTGVPHLFSSSSASLAAAPVDPLDPGAPQTSGAPGPAGEVTG